MSEEIKEILYYFEKYHFEDTMIDGKETKLLYDYITDLQNQLQQKENIIKEVREKVDNFDVFKEFTFPLMKRDEEQQVKSSIDYEWRKYIKEPILEILDKVDKGE